MPKITVQEQPEFSTLPADSILHVKIEDCQVREVSGRNGTWEKLEFEFKVLGIQAIGDGTDPSNYQDVVGSRIWGSVPFRLTDHPENRLRMWAEAILGVDLGVGYELDTDAFLRRECRALTSLYDKRAKDRFGNPIKAHQVESLLPKAPDRARPQQQAQAQPQPVGAGQVFPGTSWDEPPF